LGFIDNVGLSGDKPRLALPEPLAVQQTKRKEKRGDSRKCRGKGADNGSTGLAPQSTLMRVPLSSPFPERIRQEDFFSRGDISSEEIIRYQSPTAIAE
jgi:hypothetical protein